jgi:hypothetical protein
MTRYSNAYILLDNEDGEVIIKAFTKDESEKMMRDISKHICFSDCDDTFTIIGMYYHGREIEYDGWQPGMVMSYSYKATGDPAWEAVFPQWDH